MQEIKRVGGYLEIDKDGFIIKQASTERIPEKWKPVIEETVAAYKQHFGDDLVSVYVRGSVVKGEAIDGISDLDTIAIVSTSENISTAWGDKFSDESTNKYPFIEKVEILAGTKEQAIDPKRAVRIMLKIQAVCVYGKDVSAEIPPLKPNRESCQHFTSLQSEMQDTINFFENAWGTSESENEKKCAWIIKRILRTGFELVMECEQKYTRDLYPCYESFTSYYPDKKDSMYRTLEFAINPTGQKEKVLPILNEWFNWMPGEIE